MGSLSSLLRSAYNLLHDLTRRRRQSKPRAAAFVYEVRVGRKRGWCWELHDGEHPVAEGVVYDYGAAMAEVRLALETWGIATDEVAWSSEPPQDSEDQP